MLLTLKNNRYERCASLFVMTWLVALHPASGQRSILDQKISISVRNKSVVEVLDIIRNETDCFFNYSNSEIKASRKISKNYQQVRLGDVIRDVWGSDALTLKAQGKTIEIQSSASKMPKTTSTLMGRITDEKGEPLPGVTVKLVDTPHGTITGEDGSYIFRGLESGIYQVEVSSVGFEKLSKIINVPGKETLVLNLSMKESVSELDEVIVHAKSFEQEKREQPIKVEAIDIKKLQSQSISLPQIINQTSGVRVRQAGGIGSAATININGLQGSAIRFFKDDIPLDYLGRAFDLSLLPVEQLSNIEIYKGVLPIALGADALGGAVNFLTRGNYTNYLDVSYGMGSFNTHRVNLNGYYELPNTKLYVDLASYFLHSDNNFENEAPFTDPSTQTRFFRRVERFHDGITTGYAELKFGIKEMRFADRLEVSGGLFDLESELQNGVQLTNAYGEVLNMERNYFGTLRYKKEIGKFDIDIFGAYSDREIVLTDTTNNRYDWAGRIIDSRPVNGGELNPARKRLQTLNFETLQGRLYVHYRLNDKNKLGFSHNIITEEQVGNDPFGTRVAGGLDPLIIPSEYIRNISGLALTSQLFKGKIQNELIIKRYGLSTRGFSGTGEEDQPEITKLTNDSYGAGNSTKYTINEDLFARLSYEYSTRIPESREFLGDGQFLRSNFDLVPETSHNINFGFLNRFGNGNYTLDINSFYRFARDNILMRPNGFGFARFENVADLDVKGIETALRGKLVNNLSFTTAITYQDLRRKNIFGTPGLENSRLFNTPFFFSNVNLRYKKNNLFKLRGEWVMYANYSFVEQYYLTGIPKSQEAALFGRAVQTSDLIIPRQHVVDVGLTYKLPVQDLWLNAEINNLLDNDVFDNFRVPRPGRNCHLKVRYQLK